MPATNECICNEGWTSRADFQVKDGVACDIHLPTVLSLACVSLAVSCVGAVICLTALYLTGMKKSNGSYSKQIKITAFLFSFLGIILQSALRIHDDVRHVIGSSPGSAVGNLLFAWLICLGYTYLLEDQVTFLRKSCRFIDGPNSETGLDSKLSFIQQFSNVPPSVGFSTAIFTVLAETDSSRGDSYVIGFSGAFICIFLLYYFLAFAIFPLFIEEINKLIAARPDAPENARIKEIHRELSLALALMKLTIFMLTPTTVFFISWNFMRRKFTYLIYFSLINASIVTSVICLSFVPKSGKVGPSSASAQNNLNLNRRANPSAPYLAALNTPNV